MGEREQSDQTSAAASEPSAGEALDLLTKAGGIGLAVRSTVSWPYVVMLLGMGSAASLALPSFWLLRQDGDERLLLYPMLLMLAWLAVFVTFGLAGIRGSKRGLGRFWLLAVGVWSVLWVVAMVVPYAIGDPL